MSIFKHHKTSADRSASDRSRHKDKIRKAIRDGVHHIVSDESIIGQNGKKKIKIPVKGIKEYRFVYGDNPTNQKVGSAHDKDIKRGQRIGPTRKRGNQSGQEKPGNQKGEELYEVEITLEELSSYLFDDLKLPDLQKKKLLNIVSNKVKRKGHRDFGIRPRLSKKETLKNKIKRKKAADRTKVDGEVDESESFSFHKSDLRYKHIKVKKIKSSNAVIFFMMDTSGSMSQHKKFLARSFFFLLYHFIRNKYENTEIVFISHSSEAKEVSEDDFFKRVSSGGTIISSALEKCIEICKQRYHLDSWNIYTFHCSDGDNWPSDNEKAVNLSNEIAKMSQMYAYIQTAQGATDYFSSQSIIEHYGSITNPKFKRAYLEKKEDVWQEFRRILGGSDGLED